MTEIDQKKLRRGVINCLVFGIHNKGGILIREILHIKSSIK